MSGIEALYWYQNYPQEISAIIGLDMAVKDTYNGFRVNSFVLNISKIAADLGIVKVFPFLADSAAIHYGTLTKTEKEMYKKIMVKRTLTQDMLNEIKIIEKNTDKLNLDTPIKVPIILFSSNGVGTGFESFFWKNTQKDFMKNVSNGRLFELDCSHYIHDIEYEYIANEICIFLK